jgi:hypothetical protein
LTFDTCSGLQNYFRRIVNDISGAFYTDYGWRASEKPKIRLFLTARNGDILQKGGFWLKKAIAKNSK